MVISRRNERKKQNINWLVLRSIKDKKYFNNVNIIHSIGNDELTHNLLC